MAGEKKFERVEAEKPQTEKVEVGTGENAQLEGEKFTPVRVFCGLDRGFRRAGLFWPKGWTETEVNSEALAALKAEKKLIVEPAKG